MTTQDNGGAAFPTLDHKGHALVCREFGMSLRDWFAGQALVGICANPDTGNGDEQKQARWAYQAADAMLAARQGQSQ